jgi:hypothetical protein
VRKLDTRTPQVLIEAKFIEANLGLPRSSASPHGRLPEPDIAERRNATAQTDFGNRV